HALEDGGRAFDSHTRVDVLHRERRELPVRVELELHEDEVPELDEALAPRAARLAVRLAAAVLDAAVGVHLRVRPPRARAAGRPEVVLPWEEDDPLHRLADLLPLPEGDLVLPEPELRIAGEHGDPEPLGVDAHVIEHELPRELDRAFLEVLAEREVPEHLEER